MIITNRQKWNPNIHPLKDWLPTSMKMIYIIFKVIKFMHKNMQEITWTTYLTMHCKHKSSVIFGLNALATHKHTWDARNLQFFLKFIYLFIFIYFDKGNKPRFTLFIIRRIPWFTLFTMIYPIHYMSEESHDVLLGYTNIGPSKYISKWKRVR